MASNTFDLRNFLTPQRSDEALSTCLDVPESETLGLTPFEMSAERPGLSVERSDRFVSATALQFRRSQPQQ